LKAVRYVGIGSLIGLCGKESAIACDAGKLPALSTRRTDGPLTQQRNKQKGDKRTSRVRMYKIERRGRPTAHWRKLLWTGDEVKARKRYQQLKTEVRQGEIRLMGSDGVELAYYSAPMARTRW